jgi:anti-sigma regulatory factor (Ser/Thr protein kinase)
VTPTADPFVHPALFYRDTDEYLAGTEPFICEGLDSGEPVAVAVPGPQLELLRAALGVSAARVRMLDMRVAGRNPGRIIPDVLRGFADAHRDAERVRIIGEPIWAGRSDLEYPACVQHEALINLAFTGRPVTILCPYDVSALPERMVADAEITHPVVIDVDKERQAPGYDPYQIVRDYNLPLPEPATQDIAILKFGHHNLLDARRFAVETAEMVGMDAVRAGELEVTVGELTANSLAHGGGSGTLRTWTEHGRLCVEVSDAGHLTDPLAGRIPAGLRDDGGRGLLLAQHLSDLVRIYTTPEGTTIRAYFALG